MKNLIKETKETYKKINKKLQNPLTSDQALEYSKVLENVSVCIRTLVEADKIESGLK